MRKMSATSRADRPIGADLLVGQVLQRADHLAQDFGGDLGVKRSGLQSLVAQQHLDHADVDLLLEQVSREAVAQCVRRDALVDVTCPPFFVFQEPMVSIET